LNHENPYRILYRDNANDIYPYFEFDDSKYETAEAAFKDAKKQHRNEECAIVKLCLLKPCELPSELPSTWTSFLPDL
jgi:hypothetical protein